VGKNRGEITVSAFGDKLDKKKPATTDVQLCLDGELSARRDVAVAEVVQAAKKLDQAKKSPPNDGRMVGSPVAAAQKAYDTASTALGELEDAMRDATITLRLRAVPFADYNLFQAKNKPRPGKDEGYNPLTFFLYVARRSAVFVDDEGAEHRIEEHEWDKFEKDLSDGEHEKLAQAIVTVNRQVGLQSTAFLSRSSARTTTSSETSEQPAPKASRRSASGAGSRPKSTSRSSTTKAE
jgi:hypothetical protein